MRKKALSKIHLNGRMSPLHAISIASFLEILIFREVCYTISMNQKRKIWGHCLGVQHFKIMSVFSCKMKY